MIASKQNPLVKQMRKLQRAKGRRESNLFLLEGTHLLETACEENCYFDTVCFTSQWQARYPQLSEQAAKKAKRTEIVSPEVLQVLATTVHPDGVVASARWQRRQPTLDNLKLGLALERLQDPGNLGTILRAAAAAAADGLWLGEGSADLENPKVLRASAGAWFRLPIAVGCHLPALVSNCQARGVQVVATLPQATKTYWEVDFSRPTLLLLGNEGAGLSGELLALAEERASIPVREGIESLNVAIAAALLLYEAQRQRQLIFRKA